MVVIIDMELSSKLEVVAAQIWRGERFLLCQRPEHKKRGLMWEFPGGKVEPGETKEEALIREISEELGCGIGVDGFLNAVEYAYPDITVHLSLFRCHVISGEPQKLEHQDIQWISPAEIAEFALCPADKLLILY